MSKRDAMERYLKYIGYKFMYSQNKHEAYQYGERSSDILKHAHFIHLPKNKFQYIGIDLDWEGSASLWMDEGYPEPTITIVTCESGHSKYFYELKVPVTLPLIIGYSSINIVPYKYYKHVKHGLDKAFGGDSAYSGGTMNNPFLKIKSPKYSEIFDGAFQSKWIVHWSDKTYDLNYLSEFTKNTPRDYRKDTTIDITNRHDAMFHLTRLDTYKIAKVCHTFEELLSKVISIALNHWDELRLIQKDHPLEETEAHSVARSVTKWVWPRKDEPWLKRFTWDLGKLGFDKIDYDNLSKEEVALEISDRQRKGASYTHQKRRSETETMIRNTCERFSTTGMKLTLVNISKESGVSTSTLSRYKKLIDEYKNNILK